MEEGEYRMKRWIIGLALVAVLILAVALVFFVERVGGQSDIPVNTFELGCLTCVEWADGSGDCYDLRDCGTPVCELTPTPTDTPTPTETTPPPPTVTSTGTPTPPKPTPTETPTPTDTPVVCEIWLCHKPGTAAEQDYCCGAEGNCAPSHLDHGDYLGKCQ